MTRPITPRSPSSPGPPEFVEARLGPAATGVFTTRVGGVSHGPYDAPGGTGGLNLGFHVDDDEDRVLANRDLLDRHVGVHVAFMSQRHGARVRVVTRVPGAGRTTLGEADVLFVDVPFADGGDADAPAVAVMVADCVPLLLASASGRHVAAVHVGRQGLVAGVVPAALAEFSARGWAGGDLHASIGPSICGRCYEVPADLREQVEAAVPGTTSETSWGTPAIDLPAGVDRQLRDAGVRHVERHELCTYTDTRFYSYRRDGRTGRFAGVVRATTAS